MTRTASPVAPERKTALTFPEQITAAYLHYVKGIDQHIIAIAMGGINMGRINEACLGVRKGLLDQPREAKRAPDISLTGATNGAHSEAGKAG